MDDALVEVTQADRDAAASWIACSPYDAVKAEAEMIRIGQLDGHRLVQAFAHVRLAGVKEGLEMATAHLDDETRAYRHAQDNAENNTSKLYRMGQKDACIVASEAIRSLGPRP